MQQVRVLQLNYYSDCLSKNQAQPLLQRYAGSLSISVLLCTIDIALDSGQGIREQHTMRLQVEVITTQVNQLVKQVCPSVNCALQALVCCHAFPFAVYPKLGLAECLTLAANLAKYLDSVMAAHTLVCSLMLVVYCDGA